MLMNMATDRLEQTHIKQLLLYAPDAEEVKKYEEYRQDPSKLSEPDQFVLQVQSWQSVDEWVGYLRLCHCTFATFAFIIAHFSLCCAICFCFPQDVIGTRIQGPSAEPPLQVFSTGEDRGAEGSIRLYLQGLLGAEDQQEAG